MADDQFLPRLRIGDADREAVLALLQDAYAQGRIDIEEFEERQRRCVAAKYSEDLASIVSDLPDGQRWGLAAPAPVVAGAVAPATGSPKSAFALMSGKVIHLEPGTPSMSSFAMWGGHEIILDEVMGPGVQFELALSSLMGGYTVFVPPGVAVRDDSVCIMAGVEVKKRARGDGSNGVLVLKGFHLMGGVTVKLSR